MIEDSVVHKTKNLHWPRVGAVVGFRRASALILMVSGVACSGRVAPSGMPTASSMKPAQRAQEIQRVKDRFDSLLARRDGSASVMTANGLTMDAAHDSLRGAQSLQQVLSRLHEGRRVLGVALVATNATDCTDGRIERDGALTIIYAGNGTVGADTVQGAYEARWVDTPDGPRVQAIGVRMGSARERTLAYDQLTCTSDARMRIAHSRFKAALDLTSPYLAFNQEPMAEQRALATKGYGEGALITTSSVSKQVKPVPGYEGSSALRTLLLRLSARAMIAESWYLGASGDLIGPRERVQGYNTSSESHVSDDMKASAFVLSAGRQWQHWRAGGGAKLTMITHKVSEAGRTPRVTSGVVDAYIVTRPLLSESYATVSPGAVASVGYLIPVNGHFALEFQGSAFTTPVTLRQFEMLPDVSGNTLGASFGVSLQVAR